MENFIFWAVLSAQDKNFNSDLSPVNVIVERVIGILKVRRRCLLIILDAIECFKYDYYMFCLA